jgi:ABC-type transporter Mla MlaB component
VASTVQPAKLVLSGDCCIEGLSQHHELLLRALEDGTAVDLDLSAISRMDTAGLQLLLVFVFEMKRQHREVNVSAASEMVKQCATSAGVVELLGL